MRRWRSEDGMQADGFFEGLGEIIGTVIRWIVDGLGWLFALFATAGSDFLDGLSRALGISPSFLGMIALVIGLLLLVAAVRALLRRAFISGVIWLLLGLWLLSWLIS
ncbi:MAG: hypothetical protein RBS88_11585 [Spongiibacteraceae bacterium]|nr:hypothetical protein [Spongiibacteraceae bacterium]